MQLWERIMNYGDTRLYGRIMAVLAVLSLIASLMADESQKPFAARLFALAGIILAVKTIFVLRRHIRSPDPNGYW